MSSAVCVQKQGLPDWQGVRLSKPLAQTKPQLQSPSVSGVPTHIGVVVVVVVGVSVVVVVGVSVVVVVGVSVVVVVGVSVVVVVGVSVVVVVGVSHAPRRSPWSRWRSTALWETSMVCSSGVPGLWQMVTFCC